MHLYRFFILASCVLLSSCSSVEGFKRISSGKIGCPPGQITISDIRGAYFGNIFHGTETWTAECNGKIFYCTSTPAGYNIDISCSEAK